MGYSSGLLNHRIKILRKKLPDGSTFGETTEYESIGCVWAGYTWKKGQKALNEGALDNQYTVMFRMRWNNIITRDCLIECEGVTYQIKELHADRQANTIQITAFEKVE